MNNLANEKGSGSIYESNGISVEHHLGSGRNGGSGLSTSTVYGRNPLPKPACPASVNPLGLFAFAGTTFMISVYNAQASSITLPNFVISLACFSGGVSQIAAGTWEFYTGNLFGGSALVAYGNFWLTYAALLYPGLGLTVAYADQPGQLTGAIGIFMATWFIITLIFLLATLRVSLVMVVVFILLDLSFFFLMVGEFSGNLAVHKMGGGIGIAASIAAFYAGAAQLLTEDISWFTLPIGPIPRRIN